MTKLIPAEQWADMDCFGESLGKSCRAEVIRQAQLNALKCGMEMAATMVSSRNCREFIRNTAEKLELP